MLNINGHKSLFGCGVATANGLYYQGENGAEEAVKGLLSSKEKYAFFVMADAKPKDPKNTLAQAIKVLIEKHNLGPIIESDGWHYNEAHGPNYIKIYVWHPDWDGEGVNKWLNKHGVIEKKDMTKL